MLKSRHFYYIKVGTTKYVPKVGTKSRHIYYIKWGILKYVLFVTDPRDKVALWI